MRGYEAARTVAGALLDVIAFSRTTLREHYAQNIAEAQPYLDCSRFSKYF